MPSSPYVSRVLTLVGCLVMPGLASAQQPLQFNVPYSCQDGYTRIISDAGGRLMSDTCSALGRVMPKGTRVAAVDSAKQAHYLPAIMGVQCWFGSTAECIDAAVTGRWHGSPG